MAEEKPAEAEGKKEQKEKKEQHQKDEHQKDQKEQKKWKGKDWYAILAPEMFGKKQVGETPTIDSKLLPGKTIEVSLPELGYPGQKYYMKLKFKVNKVDGKSVNTIFHGMSLMNEHMYRIVRKRMSKVELVTDVSTKDGWALQLTFLAMMNRKTNASVQTEVRNSSEKLLKEFAAKSSIDDFVKAVAAGSIQHDIRKAGNKLYPIRFSEILKIEVKKAAA